MESGIVVAGVGVSALAQPILPKLEDTPVSSIHTDTGQVATYKVAAAQQKHIYTTSAQPLGAIWG